jgi:hypothetical protein
MSVSTRSEWSPEFTGRADHPRRGLHRIASSALAFRSGRPWSQLQPGEKKQTQEAEDEARIDIHRPSTGRTSALGRRVEKPADVRPSGPSGQTDATRHDRKHANK